MHQCCVFGCNNIANLSFPKDKKLRKLWEAATRCKDFRAKKHSKMCFAHLYYIEIGKFSGLNNIRRILKKGVVPSIFSWSKTEDIKAKRRQERAEVRDAKRKLSFPHIEKCHDLTPTPNITTTCNTSLETVALDDHVDCVEEIVTQDNNGNKPQSMQIGDVSSFRECGTQKNYQFYTIESFRNDDKGIAFYTGFESFNKFMFVFNTLCPEAYSLTYKRSQVLGLSFENQFFLTLMKLR